MKRRSFRGGVLAQSRYLHEDRQMHSNWPDVSSPEPTALAPAPSGMAATAEEYWRQQGEEDGRESTHADHTIVVQL